MTAVRADRPAIAFFGTPAAAVAFLEALHDGGWPVVAVITRPDRRRRRGGDPEPSPVGAAAARLGLPVAHAPEAALDAGADLGVVVAYGQILRAPVLGELEMVNVHFSLLPRWRGAAPVERAILAGDTETGVCLMQVTAGLDEGGVHARRAVPINDEVTAVELTDQLVTVGAALLVDELTAGLGEPVAQEGEPVYAAKIEAADRHIDWSAAAEQVHRQVRVGGAWTTVAGKRLGVHGGAPEPTRPDATVPGRLVDGTVSCGKGVYRLDRVQPEGRAVMVAADWIRGARLGDGVSLGDDQEDV